MDTKSHESEELYTTLINSIEALSKRIDKLDENLKKNSENVATLNVTTKQLDTTIMGSNKVFDQVSQGIKDLYEKVKQLELISKLMSNLGGLGPLFGGGVGPKPK